jgi:hypothetical protein
MTQRQERVLAIAAHLSATGLGIRLNQGDHACELTATRHVWGLHDIEIILDQDGYCELRCWTSPNATPIQIAAAVTHAVAAVSSVCAPALHPSQDRIEPPSGPVAGYDGAVTDGTGDGGMPGPQDQVVKPMPGPDHVPPGPPDAPREANRPAETALQERLNRLKPNHPSSPRPDDGSRKPLHADSGKDELSHSDEVEPTAGPVQETASGSQGQPDQGLETQDQPRIDADGSWHWRGRDLRPEQSRIGDRTIEECREAEGRDADGNYGDHGLTPAMRRIEAALDHGKLVDKTEEHALKSMDRFKEKLAKLIGRYPNADPKELAQGIHDGIRYTFIFEFEHYTECVELGHGEITDAGYIRIETKPSWDAAEYKGVNSRWRDPASSLLFEVQFHTQESWDAKQKTHEAYEKIDTLNVSVEENERLRAHQREVSASVRIPPGALDIQPYKKKG